eukprot:313715_1
MSNQDGDLELYRAMVHSFQILAGQRKAFMDEPATHSHENKDNTNLEKQPSIGNYMNQLIDTLSPEKDRNTLQTHKDIYMNMVNLSGDMNTYKPIDDMLEQIQNNELITKKGIENIHFILMIHGFNGIQNNDIQIKFNDTFDENDEIITISFNWKTCNSSDLYSQYVDDQTNVEEKLEYFVYFMEQLIEIGIKRLDIVCHSMGNYMLILFIEQCTSQQLRTYFSGSQIVTIAADVKIDRFEEAIKTIENNVYDIVKWTHYYHTGDKASLAESGINWNYRAGRNAITAFEIVDSVKCNKIITWNEWYEQPQDKGYIENNKLLKDLKELFIDNIIEPTERKLKRVGDKSWKLL